MRKRNNDGQHGFLEGAAAVFLVPETVATSNDNTGQISTLPGRPSCREKRQPSNGVHVTGWPPSPLRNTGRKGKCSNGGEKVSTPEKKQIELEEIPAGHWIGHVRFYLVSSLLTSSDLRMFQGFEKVGYFRLKTTSQRGQITGENIPKGDLGQAETRLAGVLLRRPAAARREPPGEPRGLEPTTKASFASQIESVDVPDTFLAQITAKSRSTFERGHGSLQGITLSKRRGGRGGRRRGSSKQT